MAGPVLVVTALDDLTADRVIEELRVRGVPVVRLDPGDFPHSVDVVAEVTGCGLGGTLTTASRTVPLDEIRAVYWRRPSAYTASNSLDARDAQWVIDQSRWGFGGVLASLPGALYVNHPWRNRDAEAKPAQLATAIACGFTVPPTLVTSEPEQARRFAFAHSAVVYKPLCRGDYRAEDGTGRTVWVRAVSPEDIDDSVAGSVHLFQARVEKQADIRVTAVGNRLFAVRIDGSLALDWRENYANLTYTPVPVPESIAERIASYLDAFGLVFRVFDFALARDGQWIMLECNPNGQWAWVSETAAGITRALADLLEKADSR